MLTMVLNFFQKSFFSSLAAVRLGDRGAQGERRYWLRLLASDLLLLDNRPDASGAHWS